MRPTSPKSTPRHGGCGVPLPDPGLQHISRLRRAEIDKKFPGLLKLLLKLSEKDRFAS